MKPCHDSFFDSSLVGFLCLLFMFSFYDLNGQTAEVKNVIPKTPEVAYFEKYGNITVDEYSGVHSTLIDLYHIKNKDIDFPLSLQYSSGGIQVAQEATWVGLGWNLKLLGSISAVPVGGPDDPNFNAIQSDLDSVINYSPYGGNSFPKIFPNVGIAGMVEGACGYFTTHPPVNIPNSNILIESDKGNTERDIYKVNLFGQSFDLFIKPISNEIFFNGEKKPYKINFQNNSWEIIDDKGYRYFFTTTDGYQIQGFPNQKVNTWHLTKVYYQNNLIINVVYDNWNIVPLPTFSEIRYIHSDKYPYDFPNPAFGNDEIIRSMNFVNGMNAKYPKYITAGMDSIVFEKASRVDLVGAPSLTSISVYSRSGNSLVKKILFKTSYFEGGNTGAESTTDNNIIKRLKLDSILIYSNTLFHQKYQFTYYPGLPYKNSFSQDFWGYYNQANNTTTLPILSSQAMAPFSSNRTLAPKTSLLAYENNIPLDILSNMGADRGVNKDVINAGTLKTIQYPTGGITQFEYEPHQVNNVKYVESGKSPVSDILKSIINNGNSSFSTPTLDFTIPKTVKAKLKIYISGQSFQASQMGAFGVSLITNIGPHPITRSYGINTPERIQEFNLKKSISIEEEVELIAGRVIFNSSVGSMPYQGYSLSNGVHATLEFTEVNLDDNNESYVGGLRVKNITNYDSGIMTGKWSYEYSSLSQPTGKLIQPMKNFYEKTYLDLVAASSGSANARYSTYYHVLSSNNNSFDNTYCPSYIGYSKVRIKHYNILDENLSYYDELHFVNKPLKGIVSAPKFLPSDTISNALNGKLAYKITFNNLLDTLTTEEYNYGLNNTIMYPINISLDKIYIGALNSNYCGQVNLVKNKQFTVIVYPYYNFNAQMRSRKIKHFFNGNIVTEMESYEYNPANFLISKVRKQRSNGVEELFETKYANDFAGSGEQLMVLNNMVGIPIESKTISNNKLKDYSKIDYAPFGSFAIIKPSAVYEMDTFPTLRLSADFMDYDRYGNLIHFQLKNSPPTVYLWGYEGQYLVAKIENVTYQEVLAALGSSATTKLNNLNSIDVSESTILNTIEELRNMLPKSWVTTYTYKPLIGMSSEINARGIRSDFKYDEFMRLRNILDAKGNILKNYQYNYRP